MVSIFAPFLCTPLIKGAYCFAPVGLLVCRPSNVHSISYDLFAWKLPNLVQWMPLKSRSSLLLFLSHCQKSRSKLVVFMLSVVMDPFCWKCYNWNMLQLLNSLFWVSRDILMGGDEFALANESPPIRISRDTQYKLLNKEFVSRLPKVTWQITTH